MFGLSREGLPMTSCVRHRDGEKGDVVAGVPYVIAKHRQLHLVCGLDVLVRAPHSTPARARTSGAWSGKRILNLRRILWYERTLLSQSQFLRGPGDRIFDVPP